MGKEAGKKAGGPAKGPKMLKCYKCGKPVTEFDTECPHCGATAPKTNITAVFFRITIGILLGFILWLFYRSFF